MMPKVIADKLTLIMEAIFKDLVENIDSAACECRNNDASTALHEVAGAIHMMDIKWQIREALEIPHDDKDPLHRYAG